MGKVLRSEHLDFFASRMNEHDKVISWMPIPSEDEYLFRITRRTGNSRNNIIVHLTDAYRYSLAEFYARPSELKAGSFVVIGMPHADAYDDVIDEARKGRIGVGHIGKFMGALNYRRMWEYWSPEERRRREEKAKQ